MRDVEKIVRGCVTCHKAKIYGSNVVLYTPLPIPTSPWEDVRMNFIMGLPVTACAAILDPTRRPNLDPGMRFSLFFLIVSNNPNTITFLNTFQILDENIYT